MKILYVVGQFPVASETFVAEEIRGLRARGHEITVAALKRPSDVEIGRMGPSLSQMVNDTRYVQRLSLLAAIRYAWNPDARTLNARLTREAQSSARSILRLTRAAAVAHLAKHCGATWVHAHWPRPTEVAMLAAKMAKLPLSISIHAHEVAHDAGHFPAAFEQIEFASFCNAAAMGLLVDRLGQQAFNKSTLMYHGVDLDQFSLRPLPDLGDGLKLVSAGRLTSTKGFERLIHAVAKARARNLPVTLTIYGDGSEKTALQKLVTDLGLQSIVTLAGWIPHEDMCQALSAHHVFVLMADDGFHDGLPNVVLESMAIGRPVILSPLPAAREVVVSGENGYVLSKVDAQDELVACCATLLDEPNLLSQMSTHASKAVFAKHDRGQLLDRFYDLFIDSSFKNRNA